MKLNLFLLSAAALVNVANAIATVELGTAGDYVILAKSGISTVPKSVITGDIAVSPIAASAITGFDLSTPPTMYSTASQVTGKVYAADYASPTPATLTTAVSDMLTAYNDGAGRVASALANVNYMSGNLDGQTLTSGVYTFDSEVNFGTLTFKGNANAVFIITTTGDVKQAANKNVILKGGAKAENIFWIVAGKVTVGAGAHLKGVLLVKTSVTFITGSSLHGRILSQTAVALQQATITTEAVSLTRHRRHRGSYR
jgi:hypothetical protein